MSYRPPFPELTVPTTIEAYFTLVRDISEGLLGAEPQPERPLDQLQNSQLVDDLFPILDGHIVDEVIVVPLVGDLLYQ